MRGIVDEKKRLVNIIGKEAAVYYKWSFRALRSLEGGEELAENLSFLLCADGRDETIAEVKCDIIEETASKIIEMLTEQGLTRAVCGDLEKHAYSVNDGIADGGVRNLHILVSIND